MSLFSLSGLRGWLYGLFGTLVLSTLWVTSLALLSARPSATELLTDAGAQVLNPFFVQHGTGLNQATYASLEASARQHPAQALALPLLTVRVLGSEITGRGYDDVVRLVYGRVAGAYYDGGADAAFAVPPELKSALPNFALFNPTNVPIVPGGPAPSQLPIFLQPFFTFVGLTPDTFTAAGNQRLLALLPWFWVATVTLGAAAVALNRSEQKLAGLAHGVLHSTWPIVALLGGLWIAALFYKTTFAPYLGMLTVVSRAFLPVYGIACAVGLVGVVLTQVLPAWQKRRQARPATAAAAAPVAGMPAGAPGAAGTGAGPLPAPFGPGAPASTAPSVSSPLALGEPAAGAPSAPAGNSFGPPQT
jgi:hypothetical protein